MKHINQSLPGIPLMRATLTRAIALLFLFLFALSGQAQTPEEAKKARLRQEPDILKGRAVLPAATFAPGPTSGQYLGRDTINGQPVPFIDKQPVQGFSAVLYNEDGSYQAMSDNGFGGIENSPDYHLRVYTIVPDFKTKEGGEGDIEVAGFIELRDPDKHIPFAIVNHFTEERILTGADFDLESFQRDHDGTLWFGDEFGPFLIHTDAEGRVLEAPFALPDPVNPEREIRAPQNPYHEEFSALRVMNAMRRHAQINGSTKTPVMSPWYVMLDDDNPETVTGHREEPPAGLDTAASGIFNVRSLQRAGFPVVVYTVNDTAAMYQQLALGVDGIISDRPDLLYQVATTYDGDKDGQPDFLTEDGLIDITKLDAQGHRGARNLRPENTLPSMEVALDYLMTTLETDCGITQDGIPVLDHDPHVEAAKTRRADGASYTREEEVLVKNLTLEEIQTTFIADKLLEGRSAQTNDRTLSPVAVAFAQEKGLIDPYVMPSLAQLFEFVTYYTNYYKTGPGSSEPEAELRWKNAEQVRFNVETKINPRTDTDDRGDVFADRTIAPEPFAQAVAQVIVEYDLQDRADIQSFDFSTLLIVHEQYPQIGTVCLFGDFPKVGEVGDGTNLQDLNGENTPWLAGLYWPYRTTELTYPRLARGSGGFEGMAYDPWHNRLLPMLERPLVGREEEGLLVSSFDLARKKYTPVRYYYPLDIRGQAIGDYVMFSPDRGLVIERDNSQGDLNGFKAIYEVELNKAGEPMGKRLAVDLLKIQDKDGIAQPALPGDVGIGGKNFAFPFVTIEDVVVLDDEHIGVLNDNNYPFSIGRHVGEGLPDDNEFIIIKLDRPLGVADIDTDGSLFLVDTENSRDIQKLKDTIDIDLATLPSDQLNVRAEFYGKEVKSVVFSFNDNRRFQVENFAPYTLLGNIGSDYEGFTPPPGVHTIVATPYSRANGEGVAGKPVQAVLRVAGCAVDGGTVATAAQDTMVYTCAGDGEADSITFRHTTTAEALYSYIITDDQQQVLAVSDAGVADFEGAGVGTCRVYGISYTGTLTVAAGDYLPNTPLSDGCAALSENFITVVREDCPAEETVARVSYYPNPLEQSLTVNLRAYPLGEVFITLTDMTGRSVYTEKRQISNSSETLELDITQLDLKQGIYVMQIASPTVGVRQYKLQKN